MGKIISRVIKARGMQKSEFARRINKSRQNIDDIIRRSSIDSMLLLDISQVLEYDFFQYYSGQLSFTKSSSKDRSLTGLTIMKEANKELEVLKKEIAYLKEINQLMREKKK